MAKKGGFSAEALGAAIGEALAGPEGAVIGDMIAKAISESLSAALDPGVAANAATGFGQQLQSTLTTAFSKTVTSALNPLSAGLAVFQSATTGAIHQMEQFAEKANPAAATRFNIALNDLAATMGQILMPVFESTTGFIREMADYLQGLKPAFAPIEQSIAKIVGILQDALGPAFATLDDTLTVVAVLMPVVISGFKTFAEGAGAAFALISEILSAMTPVIELWADGMTAAAVALRYVVAGIRELLGLSVRSAPKGHSYGAAVRSTSYAGGESAILGIGQRTTLSALQGKPGKEEDRLGEIKAKLDQIEGDVRAFFEWAQRVRENPIKETTGIDVPKTIDKVGDAVGDLARGVILGPFATLFNR